MTEDEIMKLEAGRELDALVAEHVMGWRRVEGFLVPPIGDKRNTWASEWDEDGLPDWLPEYSKYITTAWQVVEKLTERYHWNIRSPFGPGIPWFAGLTTIGASGWNGWPDFSMGAPSAPLAICRAALLAVMDSGL